MLAIPRTSEVKECPRCKSRDWKGEEKPSPIITSPIQESLLAKAFADIFAGRGGLQNDKPK